MSICNTTKRDGSGGRIAVHAVMAAALLLGGVAYAPAQPPAESMLLPRAVPPGMACPESAKLPTVPAVPPRPTEGAAANQKWPLGPDPAAAPIASFLAPLSRNDAVIEVIVGQSRLLTLKADLANEQGTGVVAVGDPTVVEFDILPNPRMLRVIGRRAGTTDLSLVTADGQTFNFEVRVVYDLVLLQAQLKQLFPDAQLHLFQISQHLAVEGQARSVRQVDQILQTLEAYLLPEKKEVKEEETPDARSPASGGRAGPMAEPSAPYAGPQAPNPDGAVAPPPADSPRGPVASPEPGARPEIKVEHAAPRIVNLLRVPGVQQVMLQVQIAELNRTALRGIGSDLYYRDGSGRAFGTNLSGAGTQNVFTPTTETAAGGLATAGAPELLGLLPSGAATGFALLPSTQLDVMLRALRTNGVMSILAEPNLVAISGQRATFLAGGEIPIPMSTITAGTTNISIEWREYGVTLEFEPYVLEDETVRLTVTPEESALDWANGIVQGDIQIPATTNRRATTTVEMRQGQSLAIAGLLRVSIDANTTRIPGLGDLPYIGPMFSNTTHQRAEKELVILVTPYLVAPMNAEDVPCLPGEELKDPNDLEFYLLNRIEGRTGRDWFSTREWDDPWHLRQLMHLEQSGICGPVGLSPCE